MVLAWVHAAAHGCEFRSIAWIVPDYGETGLPTNLAILARGEDGPLVVEDPSGGAIPLVRRELGDLVAHDVAEELAPLATYRLRFAEESPYFEWEWTITTGVGPMLEPPDPPRILGVHERRRYFGSSDACRPVGRFAVLDFAGAGEVLVVDHGDRTTDADPFTGADLWPLGTGPSESITIWTDGEVEDVRLGLIDAAGQWSGWSERIPVGGCTCDAAGAGGWASLAWLPFLWVRRRRGRGVRLVLPGGDPCPFPARCYHRGCPALAGRED